MNQRTKKISGFSRQYAVSLFFITLFVSVLLFAGSPSDQQMLPSEPAANKDSIRSVEAFKKVYTVLMSPRCVNCHPRGDVPLQGDDSHLHAMFPKRGHDGKGILTMKCTNCHQSENTVGLHMPPGNANWHLPPADMKMVFEGKSARELALQLVDPTKNGNKSLQDLIKHADDDLVLWGWNPGEGRTLPPMSHAAFKKAWITWIEAGAYAPAN
ncbi:hypothetical protein PQ465_10890 [Sphingobacterium oryzagri]|uniref:Cytochrome c domain-containing protein n=1 Tax=Sphingobacterium oryzagri TaxID=3025669 RepID=A0ABY7WD64_9SPHI|nr:hypothetical protein [Sphingobacterium sp. KACC 22765]WDF66810.1 hypothetical protein PQ465_10890 [Sphingobacterium sp. KACC 22765]